MKKFIFRVDVILLLIVFIGLCLDFFFIPVSELNIRRLFAMEFLSVLLALSVIVRSFITGFYEEEE